MIQKQEALVRFGSGDGSLYIVFCPRFYPSTRPIAHAIGSPRSIRGRVMAFNPPDSTWGSLQTARSIRGWVMYHGWPFSLHFPNNRFSLDQMKPNVLNRSDITARLVKSSDSRVWVAFTLAHSPFDSGIGVGDETMRRYPFLPDVLCLQPTRSRMVYTSKSLRYARPFDPGSGDTTLGFFFFFGSTSFPNNHFSLDREHKALNRSDSAARLVKCIGTPLNPPDSTWMMQETGGPRSIQGRVMD
ncbi:hypothetical protein B0H12DRAFT_1301544 [Mycena haematopus]|nr:hypothetical protein B0H12DRAFT_1301544 [Mycena haematopus]